MAVTWDSRCRFCRRAETKLYLKGDRCYTKKCPIEKEEPARTSGHRQQAGGRRRVTAYGEQLSEKQKLKRMYQLREKQFANYMALAQKRRGPTGENLLQLLEMRLDNAVFRLGWASSRGQARQMVTHGFFRVNGRRCNVPSRQIRPSDIIELHESKRETVLVKGSLKRMSTQSPPPWLQLDTATFGGKVLHQPARDEISTEIREQMIVEYYTR